MNGHPIAVEFPMAAPEIVFNNHRTLVKITQAVIGAGRKP